MHAFKTSFVGIITCVILFSGKSAPKKDVIEVIQQFNIQVNNLTQVSYWTIFFNIPILATYVDMFS